MAATIVLAAPYNEHTNPPVAGDVVSFDAAGIPNVVRNPQVQVNALDANNVVVASETKVVGEPFTLGGIVVAFYVANLFWWRKQGSGLVYEYLAGTSWPQ